MSQDPKIWTDTVMVALMLCAGARLTGATFNHEGYVAFELSGIPDDMNARLNSSDFLIQGGEIFRATRVLRQIIKDVKANKFVKEKYNGCPYFAN